jgi:hypothetical protein
MQCSILEIIEGLAYLSYGLIYDLKGKSHNIFSENESLIHFIFTLKFIQIFLTLSVHYVVENWSLFSKL